MCGIAPMKTGMPPGGDLKNQTILLLIEKISQHTSKNSATIKHIAGYYRKADLNLAFPSYEKRKDIDGTSSIFTFK